MFKKALKGFVMGAAMLGIGSTAAIAADPCTMSINLYGASAQFLYWVDAADDFLTSKGCNIIGYAKDSGGKTHGITQADCGDGELNRVCIRYSSKASYDGIYSCKGEVPPDGVYDCSSVTGNPRDRKMIDEATANFTTHIASGTKCVPVTLGTADVSGECFGQSSYGTAGPGCSGSLVNRTIPAIDVDDLEKCNPLVVPFGFFANKDVNDGTKDVENLTRPMAQMVFAGLIWNWTGFDAAYANNWIIPCYRHAGSGTHATMARAVMAPFSMPTTEDCTYYSAVFNDGSSQMMGCVNTNAGLGIDQGYAAVGYADCDQADILAASYPNTKSLDYQGVTCSRDAVKFCQYDFWNANEVFYCDHGDWDAEFAAWIDNLCAFSSDADNMPASKAAWWASQDEMCCWKENCFAPVTYQLGKTGCP